MKKLMRKCAEIYRGWGMRRKMLLAYAVPVMAVSVTVFVIGSAVILQRVQSQAKSSTEQAIEQAGSYVSFYLQEMEYVAQIIGSDEDLLAMLEDPDFGTADEIDESYQEFYKINRIFASLEVSNQEFRIGMYVPDTVLYSGNNYYFYGESALTQREDYSAIAQALESKGQIYIIDQDKKTDALSSTQDFLILLTRLSVERTDGTSVEYVIKVEVTLNDMQAILQNAALSQDSLLCLLDQDDNLVFANIDTDEIEDLSVLPVRSGTDWSIVTYGRKKYYVIQENLTHNRWKLLTLVSLQSYTMQFGWFLIWFLGIIGCILVCVAAASYRLARYYTGRIGALNRKMDEVQKGNLITHVPYPEEQGSRDELDMLNGSFDLMVGEVRELMKEQYKLGRSVSQAEMKALQAQINPHFLYNTLDLINWGAMDYGADEVAELARNLGQLYRLSLNHGKNAISIEDELRHVQAYYNIENVHYEGALALEIDVSDAIRSYACLNITLQPFVENAIVHGIGEHEEIKTCRITVRAWKEQEDIVFAVCDDGPGIDPDTAHVIEGAVPGKGSVGYGISNVNFRIKLTYGDKYGVRYVHDAHRRGTEARIRIRALQIDELEALTP